MRSRIRSAILVGATVSALGVALAGCTPPEQGTGVPDGGVTLDTIHFVNPLPATPVWAQIGDCMAEEAEVQGVDFSQSGPSAAQTDIATVMIQQIQDATAEGKDAIITFPASAAFGPVLQQAQDAGIITATLYGDGTPESGATVNAGVDWGVIGEQYVAAVAAVPGDHVVGLVAEGPTGVGKSWIDGFRAAAEKTDNVTVAGEVYIGTDASAALTEVTNLLTAYPEVDLVASNTGIMTAGGVAAIKTLGLEDEVHLLVINNANGGPEAVEDGVAIGVFLQDLCDLGKRTVDGVIAAAAGEDVQLIEVNSVIATKDDLDEYIEKGWN